MKMKSFLLGAVLGLAPLVASAPLQAATRPLACETADEVKSMADTGTAKHGGKAIRLEGPEAAVFLDYLNHHIGDPSNYKGDTLIVGTYPDLGYVLVAFVVNGCADQKNLVRIDPASFARAYQAAHGVAV